MRALNYTEFSFKFNSVICFVVYGIGYDVGHMMYMMSRWGLIKDLYIVSNGGLVNIFDDAGNLFIIEK